MFAVRHCVRRRLSHPVRRLAMGLTALLLVMIARPALADVINVGSGASTSEVLINFSDGARFDFDVSYDGSLNGIDLFDIIEANSTLTTDRQTFNFGSGDVTYISGITFMGHTDDGYTGGEGFWHYWVRDTSTDPWTVASIGASDRTVADGTGDGWVYGNAAAPLSVSSVPEPTSLALLGVASIMLVRRRRRIADAA